MPTKRDKQRKTGPKGRARVREEISEIAQDFAEAGLMPRTDADKISLRMLAPDALPDT